MVKMENVVKVVSIAAALSALLEMFNEETLGVDEKLTSQCSILFYFSTPRAKYTKTCPLC